MSSFFADPRTPPDPYYEPPKLAVIDAVPIEVRSRLDIQPPTDISVLVLAPSTGRELIPQCLRLMNAINNQF